MVISLMGGGGKSMFPEGVSEQLGGSGYQSGCSGNKKGVSGDPFLNFNF